MINNALVLVGKGLGEAFQIFRREIALLQDLHIGVEVGSLNTHGTSFESAGFFSTQSSDRIYPAMV